MRNLRIVIFDILSLNYVQCDKMSNKMFFSNTFFSILSKIIINIYKNNNVKKLIIYFIFNTKYHTISYSLSLCRYIY
jgi:16S rRNA A1518/A1519 N6-dimethyltransferase RsmA/KsgA/DIM1 with predicted DNA glycosylase/AP lyase activity